MLLLHAITRLLLPPPSSPLDRLSDFLHPHQPWPLPNPSQLEHWRNHTEWAYRPVMSEVEIECSVSTRASLLFQAYFYPFWVTQALQTLEILLLTHRYGNLQTLWLSMETTLRWCFTHLGPWPHLVNIVSNALSEFQWQDDQFTHSYWASSP